MDDRQPFIEPISRPITKAEEVKSFLFLTAVLAPFLAVMIVAGYGFLVWMYQVFAGPPGPTGH